MQSAIHGHPKNLKLVRARVGGGGWVLACGCGWEGGWVLACADFEGRKSNPTTQPSVIKTLATVGQEMEEM